MCEQQSAYTHKFTTTTASDITACTAAIHVAHTVHCVVLTVHIVEAYCIMTVCTTNNSYIFCISVACYWGIYIP
jgi:hypothetical protein